MKRQVPKAKRSDEYVNRQGKKMERHPNLMGRSSRNANLARAVTVQDIVRAGGDISMAISMAPRTVTDAGHPMIVQHPDCRNGSPTVTPSSDKKVMPSGATRSGHLQERYDLISPEAMRRRALVYGHGAATHGDRNWEKGMPISECLNRAIRHLNLYLSGDTSEDHLAHASVNLDFVMHYEHHNPECLDVSVRHRRPLED